MQTFAFLVGFTARVHVDRRPQPIPNPRIDAAGSE